MENEEDSKIVVVIPTYNEIMNIEGLIKAVFEQAVCGRMEIIVVDDSSPDGTGAKIAELAISDHRICLLSCPEKQGLGPAYVAGFRLALERGADIIIQMDADFSHDPADLPRLIGGLSSADVVIGSRYVINGKLDAAWGAGRRVLSWWANRVWTKIWLGLPINDVTAGFRAWRRSALQGINFNDIKANGYFFQIEMAHAAVRLGYRVLEMPIFFKNRRHGLSKMDFKLQFEAAAGVFLLRCRTVIGRMPKRRR